MHQFESDANLVQFWLKMMYNLKAISSHQRSIIYGTTMFVSILLLFCAFFQAIYIKLTSLNLVLDRLCICYNGYCTWHDMLFHHRQRVSDFSRIVITSLQITNTHFAIASILIIVNVFFFFRKRQLWRI